MKRLYRGLRNVIDLAIATGQWFLIHPYINADDRMKTMDKYRRPGEDYSIKTDITCLYRARQKRRAERRGLLEALRGTISMISDIRPD